MNSVFNAQEYQTISKPDYTQVVVNVESVKHFILQTKEKNYILDFQRLLEDYGVEVKG